MVASLAVLLALALGAPAVAGQESYTYKYSTNWFDLCHVRLVAQPIFTVFCFLF